ncbi:MAG: EAL domain-containing protein [Gammaproteobacteria bacterium]
MTDPVRSPSPGHSPRTGLAVKITGIVFWGLVLVGLTMSVIVLRRMEIDLQAHYARNAEHFAAALNRYLRTHPAGSRADFEPAIQPLLRELDFSGVQIDINGVTQRFGAVGGHLTPVSAPLAYRGDGAHPLVLSHLVLYHQNLHDRTVHQRKQLLATMGVLFLLFGFILQWVLQKLLTSPFLRMVATAQAFSGGNTDQRFDEARRDEFGFLGKFINQALDYVLLQQEELREALGRVRESESALYQEKEKAEVTLHSIGDAVITTDAEGRIEYFNPVAETLTGWVLPEARGRLLDRVMTLYHETTRETVANPVVQCLRTGQVVELSDQTILVRENGEEVAIADSAAPIRDRAGQVIGAVMVFHDVGHARRLARQLSYQATHDALTGLHNRREFEHRMQLALHSAREEQCEHAVCYLDLDQFKIVNDTCGHVAGDEMLRQLAGMLQAQVRESDVLARLGGDEFGVLLHYCDLGQARRVAENLRTTVRDFRFVSGDHGFEIGVSIGLVAVSAESHSLAEVMSAADVACYAAKDGGRNRVHVYEPDDGELKRRQGEMRWVSRLQKGLEQNRFCLHFQPIVPLDPSVGAGHYEVLLRMRDEQGLEVPPMAFIPAAERYNLMPSIDRWVVRTVLETASAQGALPSGSLCAMNLSGQSLCDDQFLDFVIEQLERTGFPPEQACFEITETAAIANLHWASRFITTLKGMGCRFALDDFGSGLSSFGYLKNLPVDFLKIDGSFVRDMGDDPIDLAMVEAINRIGHVMGIRTIAEFVENERTMETLRDIGVDYAQGYWIARPAPFSELMAAFPRQADGRSVGG